MATYTLALQDVEDYLDSKKDDEVIGITGDACACLVARALHTKYPHTVALVNPCSISIRIYQHPTWNRFEPPKEISNIIRAFDRMTDDDGCIPITKREWEMAK